MGHEKLPHGLGPVQWVVETRADAIGRNGHALRFEESSLHVQIEVRERL